MSGSERLVMRVLLAWILCWAVPVMAAAPEGGSERLRELVVFPELTFSYHYGIDLFGDEWAPSVNDNVTEIFQLRNSLNQNANDVSALLALGALLNYQNQAQDVQAAYGQAERICRSKVSANPEDGAALDNLGEALWGLGRNDEAEIMYRKAVLVSSNDWQCWVRLGNFLSVRQLNSILPNAFRNRPLVGLPPPAAVLNYRPPPGDLANAQSSLDEASRCFARAMHIAPREADVFLQYAGFLTASNWQSCLFAHWLNNRTIEPSAWLTFVSGETIANLQKAADLDRENCDDVALAAYFEWMKNVAQFDGRCSLEMLPSESRRLIFSAMARLESLSQNPDKKKAARVCEILGVLHLAFKDPRTAADDFRRATLLDPARDYAWDLLLLSLSREPDQSRQFQAVCESRLKYADTPWNHLLLAKAFVYQREWEAAGQQAQLAADFDTNSVAPQLFVVAVALKQNFGPDDFQNIQAELGRISQLVAELPADGETWLRWRELSLDTAIFYGLENTADSQRAAERCLAGVFKFYPNDPTAHQILQALRSEGPLNNFPEE